jgi:deoxycytidine triphosphate deaminase
MFIEITPLTFNIRVKPGIPLSQLRLFYGNPENSIITGKELFKTVLPNDTIPDNERDGCLTLDLDNTQIGAKHELGAAFQAVPNDEPISLWTTEPKADAKKYWKLKSPTVIGSQKRLEIDNKAFYILRSKQRIRLTQNVAVYCRATDETFGEMRIHYAGFAHPFFGRERKDHGIHGTPLCFEVRGHDVQVVLTHGEKMAELVFYRMSEDCEQETTERRYTDQDLQLSSFFGDWES